MKEENAGTPAVSIIIPVYNAENFLARCVDSVLGQEYTEFELLLIDDGSKDKSGAMCDAYAASDSRVRVFHKENAGVSAARNQARDRMRAMGIALRAMYCLPSASLEFTSSQFSPSSSSSSVGDRLFILALVKLMP